jgi:tetratricopeptide (TPR) repeat protein
LAPEEAWIWGGIGVSYRNMGNMEEAETCLRRAIALNDKMPWIHRHLGLIMQQKKDYDAALKQFQLAISLDPEYAWPHLGLADIYLEHLKRPEKAIAKFEMALRLEKRPFRLHRPMFGLARALEVAGRTAEARQRYQEYLDRFPWGEHAQEALAALERLG